MEGGPGWDDEDTEKARERGSLSSTATRLVPLQRLRELIPPLPSECGHTILELLHILY